MSAPTAARLGLDVDDSSFEGGEVDAGNVQTRMVAIRVGDQAIELPAWIQPGHPNDSITVTMGFGRDLETERLITDRNLLDRLINKDADIYRPGPVANGIGANANAALLRGADGASVIPAAATSLNVGSRSPLTKRPL